MTVRTPRRRRPLLPKPQLVASVAAAPARPGFVMLARAAKGVHGTLGATARVIRTRPWILVMAAIALAVAGRFCLPWVVDAGRAIYATPDGRPVADGTIIADYLIALLMAMLVAACLRYLPVDKAERRALRIIWAVKAFVVLVLMLAYESRYGSSLDALGYFRLSGEPIRWDLVGWGGGTGNTALFAWSLDWLLPRSYHALKLTFALIGFIGVYAFYRGLSLFMRRREVGAFYVLALYPSVLFWSSVLGKDPVVLAGIGVAALGAGLVHRGRLSQGTFCAILGIGIAGWIRPWIGLALLAPFLLFLHSPSTSTKRPWGRRAVGFGALLLMVLGGAYEVHSLSSQAEGGVVGFIDARTHGWDEGGSGQVVPEFNDWWDVLVFLPWGAFTALFRPLPGEIQDPLLFGALIGIENLALLGALLLGIIRSKRRDWTKRPVMMGLVFIGMWLSVYAFISPQNLGAAVRFKLQVLMPLLTLVLYLHRSRLGMWKSNLAAARQAAGAPRIDYPLHQDSVEPR